MKFLRYRETMESLDAYLAEFDLLRRVAGHSLRGGCSFPDAFTTILRMEGATLRHNQKALVLASTHGQMDMVGVSRQMRRLFGLLGSGGHKDALATAQEFAVPREALGEQGPPGIHHNGHKHADWEETVVSPEEWEASSAFRKACREFRKKAPRQDNQ